MRRAAAAAMQRTPFSDQPSAQKFQQKAKVRRSAKEKAKEKAKETAKVGLVQTYGMTCVYTYYCTNYY